MTVLWNNENLERNGHEFVPWLMGHASVKYTGIYAKILDGELDKAMEIFSE